MFPELCSDMISCLKGELFQSFSSAAIDTDGVAGIDTDDVPGLKELFDDDDNLPFLKPFSSVETPYLQMQCYKKHLNSCMHRHIINYVL